MQIRIRQSNPLIQHHHLQEIGVFQWKRYIIGDFLSFGRVVCKGGWMNVRRLLMHSVSKHG